MNRILILLASHALLLSSVASAQTAKPNIVYIMADELGYFELSHMGHRHIRTPVIDRMAREGVRFTHCFAGSSLCAPTRCTLMTGKHTGHTSVRTNGGGTPLRAEEETVASLLRRAGYATGGFGKWGCGGRGSTGVPEKHGFDVFYGYYDQVHAHSYFPPYLVRNSEEMPLEGNRGGRSGKTYAHAAIMDEALSFIRKNKDQPFFCYLPITPPHGMFDIPDDHPGWAVYKDKPWPEEAKRYAAMVTMVDLDVGRVFALLRELSLDETTLVVFCGDNGGNDYFRSSDHPRGFHAPNVDPRTGKGFRGKKGTLYEGGLRIPMIARWPGKIEGGRVSDLKWWFPDVLPTLAELSGAKAPSDVDGLSIVPELVGEKAAGRAQKQHSHFYWELGGRTAVRRDSWKAVRARRKGSWELYDLRTDGSESSDVSADHPKIVAQLSALAKESHTPAVEGSFGDRTLHEKDRRAKWGTARRAGRGSRRTAVNRLPTKDLLPRKVWKVLRVSSQNEGNGKLAKNAFDGKPTTHWHTRFGGDAVKHPHELVIDLGQEHDIRGVRYLARQDRGWNGAVARCDLTVSTSGDTFGDPVLSTTFAKVKTPQEKTFSAVRGRYVRLRIHSEVNGGPWASVSELGLIGK